MKLCSALFMCFISLFSISNTDANETCITVDGSEGHCVPPARCNWVHSRALTEQNISSKSKCGIRHNYSNLVCCPKWKNSESCGNTANNSNSSVDAGTFPWVVDVIYHVKRQIYAINCAGSLINSQYVLTAAHCILDLPMRYKPYRIRVKHKSYQEDYEIQKSIIHPNYSESNFNKVHDIALLRLADTVQFTQYLQPVCLPDRNDHISSLSQPRNLTIFSVGPRRTVSTKRIKRPILMPEHDNSVCNDLYRELNLKLDRSQLCVGGEPGRDACRGDSGGPLMQQQSQRWFQVGIVSLGPPRCGGSIPGIYVNLLEYIDWIEATVAADQRTGTN
ncbi:CLIP domain-containing serine protease B15-like [Topomyia yanbarensis]|uniref:CLIP domain-containing serine protease B15-like n=1 Tax=Topomyia yanbarensis TaxID=2498891 RepID=UPI00273BA33A|nr:CLIP domain-containing serine protease B15-like [Topomyia yanbarensis]